MKFFLPYEEVSVAASSSASPAWVCFSFRISAITRSSRESAFLRAALVAAFETTPWMTKARQDAKVRTQQPSARRNALAAQQGDWNRCQSELTGIG